MDRSWLFVVTTLGVSWFAAWLFWWLGGDWHTGVATAFAVGYMFIPLLVSVGFAVAAPDRTVTEQLGMQWRFNRWWFVAWFAPLFVALAAMGVALLFPGVGFTTGVEGMLARYGDTFSPEQTEQIRQSVKDLPVHPFWLAILQGLVAGATINAVTAFGEEAGWRGFLYGAWRELGFWKYSGLIGGIWGLWHAPLILQGHNYPDHPVAGVGMMILFCVLYSPVFTLMRDRAGSVFAAAILHGTINGTVGVAIILLDGGSDLLVGVTGLAGLLVLIAVNAVVAAVWVTED